MLPMKPTIMYSEHTLSVVRTCQAVSQSGCTGHIPTCNVWAVSVSASSPAFGVLTFFYLGHADRCVVTIHCDFNLRFPDGNDADIFSSAYVPSVYPLR